MRALAGLLVVMIFVGCTSAPRAEKTSDVRLQVQLIESADGSRVQPCVVLVGDGFRLMSDQAMWVLHGTVDSADYLNVLKEKPKAGMRLEQPYFVYDAWRDTPDMRHMSVVAPVWRGPFFDAATLRNAEQLNLVFAISYVSADSEFVSGWFEFPLVPYDTEFKSEALE